MKRLLVISAVTILSSGLIVPLYFSGEWLLGWLRHVVTPAILSTEAELHSFPYLHEAAQAWFIAAIWFGAAVVFWAALAAAAMSSLTPAGRQGATLSPPHAASHRLGLVDDLVCKKAMRSIFVVVRFICFLMFYKVIHN